MRACREYTTMLAHLIQFLSEKKISIISFLSSVLINACGKLCYTKRGCRHRVPHFRRATFCCRFGKLLGIVEH